ncbi:MAG: helix-turn-helix domain-containing protein [Gemmatimonadetes bacterium]|nr:helix-turn-helix domain-containing protein [Gemmatimonadota bacterium]
MREFASELRAHRESSGMSFEELFERTRINPEYLRAIESGDYDVLPEIYVRLFVKKYAQEVGLDVEETLAKYEKNRPFKETTQAVASRVRERSLPMGRILGILCVLALIAVIAGVFLRRESTSVAPVSTEAPVSESADRSAASGPEPTTTPDSEVPPVAPESPYEEAAAGSPRTASLERESTPVAPVSTEAPVSESADRSAASGPEPTTTPDPEVPPAAPEGPFEEAAADSPRTETLEPDNAANPAPGERVVSSYSLPQQYSGIWEDKIVLRIDALMDTRVLVFSDGDSTFHNRLLSGTQRQWTALDRFRVEIEDPAAVSMSLQDKPVSLPTKHGRKHRLFISRSNVWVEEIESASPPPVR